MSTSDGYSSTHPMPQEDIDGDGRWLALHLTFVQQGEEREPDVVFIGDSIVQQLQFLPSWSRYIEPLHVLNFGIRHDTTQNVLWRILEGGELDHCHPKVVVLGVGSEHPRQQSAHDIVMGIEAVINAIEEKQPGVTLIVLGLLPCGRSDNGKRERHSDVNRLLARRLQRRSISAGVMSPNPQDLEESGNQAILMSMKTASCNGAVSVLLPDWSSLFHGGPSSNQSSEEVSEKRPSRYRLSSISLADESVDAPPEVDLVSHLDMFDYMHLTEQGFNKVWCDALVEELQSCLHTFMKTGDVTITECADDQ